MNDFFYHFTATDLPHDFERNSKLPILIIPPSPSSVPKGEKFENDQYGHKLYPNIIRAAYIYKLMYLYRCDRS